MTNWLTHPQPRLGLGGLIVLLAVANLSMPLCLDMYTPAIPHMTAVFNASESLVNLTLALYTLFYAMGMLLFGPISDKCGRRPVLILGMGLFALGNLWCAITPLEIWSLIAARAASAIGSGAVSAVSVAIVKDAFRTEMRGRVLAIIQALFVIGPVVAPILGAMVLQVSNWRAIFFVLAIIGAICLMLSLLFAETLPNAERDGGSLAHSMAQLVTVAQNAGFATYTLILAVFSIAFMGFIAAASYIYISFFGLTDLEYALFFAGTSLLTIIGPIVSIPLRKRIGVKALTYGCIFVSAGAGVLVIACGQVSPFGFCAALTPFPVALSTLRPVATDVLLAQQDHSAGAAASVINFASTALGCVGMLAVMLPWPNFIVGVGVIVIACMIASAALWFALFKLDVPLKGMNR